jgi:hypothetical protein
LKVSRSHLQSLSRVGIGRSMMHQSWVNGATFSRFSTVSRASPLSQSG